MIQTLHKTYQLKSSQITKIKSRFPSDKVWVAVLLRRKDLVILFISGWVLWSDISLEPAPMPAVIWKLRALFFFEKWGVFCAFWSCPSKFWCQHWIAERTIILNFSWGTEWIDINMSYLLILLFSLPGLMTVTPISSAAQYIQSKKNYVLPFWTIKVVANNVFESVDSFLLLFLFSLWWYFWSISLTLEKPFEMNVFNFFL